EITTKRKYGILSLYLMMIINMFMIINSQTDAFDTLKQCIVNCGVVLVMVALFRQASQVFGSSHFLEEICGNLLPEDF
ncbi:hypothetical protein ACJX0J_012395, partial [Zea mays]